MITIKEIADMLGISTTTVSNVIHGKTKEVSQSTIDCVKKVMEEYEYVPNFNASNLASNKSRIIGVAIVDSKMGYDNYLQDAFIGELVGSIEKALRFSGYFMMMYFSNSTDDIIKTILSWNVDGMIMFGMRKEDCQAIRNKFKKPQVFIDSYVDDIYLNGVNIGLDDNLGGYIMGNYLLSMGHRKIAFVADNFEGSDYRRYCGFAKALSEHNVFVGTENFIKIQSGKDKAQGCIREIAERSNIYTAFFCASDYYALLLINALADRCIRVPEDVSVCGFDDNIHSRLCRPKITTIHQSASEKGELAVEYMLKQLKGEEIKNKWIVLPVELCERDSVKKITSDTQCTNFGVK